MAPANPESKPSYQKDEKALCFHGELLYEAKILDVRKQDPKDKTSPFEYRVHYKGWKNTWDDWVPQDRLRKNTEENRELAINLKKASQEQHAARTKASANVKSRKGQASEIGSGRGSEERNSSVPARGTKRARDNDIEKLYISDLGSPAMTTANASMPDTEVTIYTAAPEKTAPIVTTGATHQSQGGNMQELEVGKAFVKEDKPSRTASTDCKTEKIQVANENSSQTAVGDETAATSCKPTYTLPASAYKQRSATTQAPEIDKRTENAPNAPKVDKEGVGSAQRYLEAPRRNEDNVAVAVQALIADALPPRRTWHLKLPSGLTMYKFMGKYGEAHPNDPRSPLIFAELQEPREDYIDYLNRGQPRIEQLVELVPDEIYQILRPPQDNPEYKVNKGPDYAPLIGGTHMHERLAVNKYAQQHFAQQNKSRSARAKQDKAHWRGDEHFPIQEYIPGLATLRYSEKTETAKLGNPKNKAGVPIHPLCLDPPGFGGPFDASKFLHITGNSDRLGSSEVGRWNTKINRRAVVTNDPLTDTSAKATEGRSIRAGKRKSDAVEDSDDAEPLAMRAEIRELSQTSDQSTQDRPGAWTPAPAGSNQNPATAIRRATRKRTSNQAFTSSAYATPASAIDITGVSTESNDDNDDAGTWKRKKRKSGDVDQPVRKESRRRKVLPKAEVPRSEPESVNHGHAHLEKMFNIRMSSAKNKPNPGRVKRACPVCRKKHSKCTEACYRKWVALQQQAQCPNSTQSVLVPAGADDVPSTSEPLRVEEAEDRDNSFHHTTLTFTVASSSATQDTSAASIQADDEVEIILNLPGSSRLEPSVDTFRQPRENAASSIREDSAGNEEPKEEAFSTRPSIRLPLPDHLKNLLVDDWENVTKSDLFVPLPSKAPANFIIDQYWNEEKKSRRLGSVEADILEEFCMGLKTYFEKALGKILLYRAERQQLQEVRKWWESGRYPEWEGKGVGDCYGGEHLARLLVNMPELTAQTNMDAASVARLKEELSKFTVWLSRNSEKYFVAKYEKLENAIA